MMASRPSGWRAATCRLLKPPQEMPIMPMRPVHQGCLRSQAMTDSASCSSCSEYSSSIKPCESPLPRMSTRMQA